MNGRLTNELKIEESINRKLATMPDYVSAWNMNMKASRKSAATRRDYVYKIHSFLTSVNGNSLSVKPSDITEGVVTGYFTSIQTKTSNGTTVYTSDSYQQTVWSCMYSFLDFLEKRGAVNKNYMKLIARPKNHDLDRINEHRILLGSDDFRRIVTCVDDETNLARRNRDRAILILFMNTGMRKSALANIMLDDIDLDDGSLSIIDKGNKRHVYVLNDSVTAALREWIEVRRYFDKGKHDDHLFLSSHGNGMSGTAMYDVVAKYTNRALGRRISPHKLRSGYCSILYNATGDIEFVRRAVGHASSQTTQRYIVTNGSEKQKASEIMEGVFS